MKAVILAGGLGTRISEETVLRPKPMVEIGGKPILWYIMKTFIQLMVSMILSYVVGTKVMLLRSTLREKNKLNELWVSGKAPWKVW